MASAPSSRLIAAAAWLVPYFLLGLVSWHLDDPLSSVAYVWLPTGLGVAGLLLVRSERWPDTIAAILIAELLLRGLRGEMWLTLLVLALVATGTTVLTAWLVQRLSPARRGMGFVGALLAGSAAGAVLNAVVDVAWISYAEQVAFATTALHWAIADFVGILVVAPLVLGWAQFRPRRSGGPTRRDFQVGLAAFLALLASSFYLFDGNTATRFSGSVGFALTWLPMLLVVVVGLIWGPRGGTLAVLALALQVLLQTSQGDGPFASLDGQRGESILEAQVYLAAIAVLMMLLNTLRSTRELALEQAAAWRARFELALAGSNQLMYRYDPYRNLLEWGGDLESAFGMNPEQIDSVEALLSHVHPADRQRVKVFWTARASALPADQGSIQYRIAHAEGGWRSVTDIGSPLTDADGELAVVAGLYRIGSHERQV